MAVLPPPSPVVAPDLPAQPPNRLLDVERALAGSATGRVLAALEALRDAADPAAMLLAQDPAAGLDDAVLGVALAWIDDAALRLAWDVTIQEVADQLRGPRRATQTTPATDEDRAVWAMLALTFPDDNAALREFLAGSQYQLGRGLTDEIRNAVRTATQDLYRERLTVPDAARQLRAHIGLNQRQSATLTRYAQGLRQRGLASRLADARIQRFADQLLRQRADLIARTELLRAGNMARQEGYLAMARQGYLLPSTRRLWIVTLDGRTDPLCRVMTGKTAALDLPFENGAMFPPLHPRCRCTTSLVFNAEQTVAQIAQAQKLWGPDLITGERADILAGIGLDAAAPAVLTGAMVRQAILAALADRQTRADQLQQESDTLYTEAKAILKAGHAMLDRFYAWKDQAGAATPPPPEIQGLLDKYEALMETYHQMLQRASDLYVESKALRTSSREFIRETFLYQDAPNRTTIRLKRGTRWTPGERAELDAGIDAWRRFMGDAVELPDVEVGKDRGARSFYRRAWNDNGAQIKMRLRGGEDYGMYRGSWTMVHELMHHVETTDPRIRQAVLDYYERRTAGDTLRSLRETNAAYDRTEVYRPDRWFDAYMGRDYNNGQPLPGTHEVLTMGVQYMLWNPEVLMKKDPDLFDFVYNVIRNVGDV